MAEWQVARPTGRCAVCDRVLAEGERFCAVLVEREGTLERLDYDEEHWTAPPADGFCFWRSRVPYRDRKRKVVIDNDTMMELFRRLGQADSPAKKQFRFVLALWMMRKKLLRFEQTVREEQAEFWQMRLPADDSVHRVERVMLSDTELASANEQLQGLLEGGAADLAGGGAAEMSEASEEGS